MPKQGPEYSLALEFLRAFPGQAKYGRKAAEVHIKKLLGEGHEPPTLLRRLLLWSRVRDDLRPWELVKDPPPAPILPAAARTLLDPKTLPPVDERIRRRVQTILSPYPEEDV